MTRKADQSISPSSPPEGVASLRRRDLLRRGAILAGAATGAAAVAAPSDVAHAADGDNLVLGEVNAATSLTTLTVGGDVGGVEPALALQNADGPALRTNVLSATWAGQLALGEVAGTDLGPIVGVETAAGATTTYLVTGVDLANVATPFASTPSRVLDLRTEAGRAGIIRRSSPDALAADGRLRAGQWIDIAVAFTGSDFVLDAVFANLTAVFPLDVGWAALYPPGVQPPTSNVNFVKDQVVANAAFVGAGTVLQHHAVRLFTSADCWFVIDVSGGVTRGSAQTPLAVAAAGRAAGGRLALVGSVLEALARTD